MPDLELLHETLEQVRRRAYFLRSDAHSAYKPSKHADGMLAAVRAVVEAFPDLPPSSVKTCPCGLCKNLPADT